jgi:hypothetical protein
LLSSPLNDNDRFCSIADHTALRVKKNPLSERRFSKLKQCGLDGLIDLNECVFGAGACKERFPYLHESLDDKVEPLNLDVLPEAGFS